MTLTVTIVWENKFVFMMNLALIMSLLKRLDIQ